MVGDSVTFGYGVDQTASFPAHLERLLAAQGAAAKYEVINAGVPGFNIRDEASLLPILLDHYKPDLVLWTVVSNDYDDSLGIDKDGRIIISDVDHVIDAGHIASWGYDARPNIDVQDFRRSMVTATRAQVEGRPLPPSRFSKFDSWLSSHVYAYSFVRNRSPSFPRIPDSRGPTEAEYFGKFKTSDGRDLLTLFFSAVYSSRHVIEQANKAIEQAGRAGKERGISIVLVGTSLPIDPRWKQSNEFVTYQDLSEYQGDSYVDFYFKSNLGWDGHPSVRGNQQIADALLEMLNCQKLLPESKSCHTRPTIVQDMRRYWEDFDERRGQFESRYYGPIDLDSFQGIHQILGGIVPSRVLPGPLAKRANVLLPNDGANSIEVTATLETAEAMTLRLTAFAGDEIASHDYRISQEDIKLSLDLMPIKRSLGLQKGPIDLQLECVSKTCPELRLHRMSTLP